MKLIFIILGAAFTLLILPATDSAFFGSDCGNNKTHNYLFGTRVPFQSLLYTKHVIEEGKFLRKLSVDVSFPPNGIRPLGQIRRVEILDQTNEGTGGCVYLKNGGVGADYVSLLMKSQRNYGLDFYVFIYGTLYY